MFTYSNTSLSLNSLLRFSHPGFDQPGPGDVMIHSILFNIILMNHITSSIHFFNNVCHFLCVVHARYSSILAENTPEWLYFSSVGYHTNDHSFIHTLLRSLISFFFLFSSNISQVSQIEPWLGGSEYLVWLVITIDRYASRST